MGSRKNMKAGSSDPRASPLSAPKSTSYITSRGRLAQLLVEGPGIESAKIFVRTEAGEKFVLLRERRSPDLGSYTYYPARLTHVAGPSVVITGVVRDAETQRPLSGVTVKSQSRHGEPISGWGPDFVRAVSDDQGRYRLEGMPVGSNNRIAAIAPDCDIAYLSMSEHAATDAANRTREIGFDLRRGVWIKGRITDKRTGKGLSGRLAYYVKKTSPSYQFVRALRVDQRDRLLSDDVGHFRIAVLPGPGYITFMADEHQDYPRAETIVTLDGTQKKIGTSMLKTGPFILMAQFYTWNQSAGVSFNLKGYDPESGRHVYSSDLERNLAGHVLVNGLPAEELVVQLQPAGKHGGRRHDAHAIQEITPEVDAAAVDVTIRLQRGTTVTGRIVDGNGESINEALVISHLITSPLSLFSA